jgi:hypothetical protein
MKGNILINNYFNKEQYNRRGFFKAKCLSSDHIGLILNIFHRSFDIESLPNIYDTIANTPVEIIKLVNKSINEICEPLIQEELSNFKIVCSIFFIKKSGENSEVGLHIDRSMTTEEFNNIAIWIPLIDIDSSIGQMCLLEGAQNILPPYFTPLMPPPFLDTEEEVRPHLTCIDMKAGEALYFNNNIAHCTPINTSGKDRIAVVIKVIDENAPLVTAYYKPEGKIGEKVAVYEQEHDFFYSEKFKLPNPPLSSKFIKFVPNLPIVFKKHDVSSIISDTGEQSS